MRRDIRSLFYIAPKFLFRFAFGKHIFNTERGIANVSICGAAQEPLSGSELTMNDYVKALKNYATFSGRSRRREYWMFILFNIICVVLTFGIDIALLASVGIGGLNLVYSLGVLIPSIAVTVRRLHDTGRSGWWILIGLVPVVGIVLLVFMCLDSQPGTNQYGPNPKGATASQGELATS